MAPNRRLKQARELRGWSQAKVAEEIGTDATTVSRWERGLFSPTPYFRERLCKLFNQNAEELGLLESADYSSIRERSSSVFPTPLIIPSLHTNGEWRGENVYTGNTVSLLPPSWPKRTDTFSYILHSATYDQQAHMLWGDAYVRALQGQRAEAIQLGEASLSAFEHVGHPNANVIREWLNQREFTSSPSPTAHVPPMPSPILPERHKRSTRRFAHGKGAGAVLTLLLVVVLAFAGFSLNHLGPTVLASPPTTHLPSTAQTTAHAKSSARPTNSTSSTPEASPTSESAPPPAFTAQVLPANLTPQNCYLEPLGYRCTLEIWLSAANSQGNIPWHASSSNVFVQFNPPAGTDTVGGAPEEVIVYVKSLPGQSGQLIFTFTLASHVYTASVFWKG